MPVLGHSSAAAAGVNKSEFLPSLQTEADPTLGGSSQEKRGTPSTSTYSKPEDDARRRSLLSSCSPSLPPLPRMLCSVARKNIHSAASLFLSSCSSGFSTRPNQPTRQNGNDASSKSVWVRACFGAGGYGGVISYAHTRHIRAWEHYLPPVAGTESFATTSRQLIA